MSTRQIDTQNPSASIQLFSISKQWSRSADLDNQMNRRQETQEHLEIRLLAATIGIGFRAIVEASHSPTTFRQSAGSLQSPLAAALGR